MKPIRAIFASLLALIGATSSSSTTGTAAPDFGDNPAVQKLLAWQEEKALPAAMLESAGPAADTPGGSRIGGAVWLPEGEAWPVDGAGQPLSFLAQIDFAEMPPLADYPASGVLQFFIGRDDYYGANFENPELGSFRVIYREDLSGPGRLERAVPRGTANIDDYSPLYDATVRQGVALSARATMHKPSIGNWWLERDLGPLLDDREDADSIYEYVDAAQAGEFGVSHVGGHPEFTQSDWRYDKPYNDVDRVLLNLWSDNDNLMWGDMGQGQFLIRREDLLRRDFSKAFYQWDCY